MNFIGQPYHSPTHSAYAYFCSPIISPMKTVEKNCKPVHCPKFHHFTPTIFCFKEAAIGLFLEPINREISAEHVLYSISFPEVAFTSCASSNITQKLSVMEMSGKLDNLLFECSLRYIFPLVWSSFTRPFLWLLSLLFLCPKLITWLILWIQGRSSSSNQNKLHPLVESQKDPALQISRFRLAQWCVGSQYRYYMILVRYIFQIYWGVAFYASCSFQTHSRLVLYRMTLQYS